MKPWVFFIAGRYFKTRRRVGRVSPQSLQVAGIAVGVMALVTVMGVMNGLQLGFIEDILEISSYHLRIEAVHPESVNRLQGDLKDIRGVKAALPFRDVQTMGRGMFENFESILLRCVPEEAADLDPALIEQLGIYRGSFDLSGEQSIVVGYEYALEAGIHIGDSLSLVSLASEGAGMLRPATANFTVTGLFRSGYYDFDRSLAFVSLSDYPVLAAPEGDRGITVGIKLHDRFRDLKAVKEISGRLGLPEASVVSWREYNRSFFGALRMEKLAMMFLVGLIFLVVGVNIFHSQRRAVYERQEEIGILKSLGAGPGSVRLIFLFDGLFIGLTGAVIGLILGLLITTNVNIIFSALETVGNLVIRFGARLFFSGGRGGIDFFSPSYFYLLDVPVRIIFEEVLAVFCFAAVSSSLAAYFASARVSRIYPQQVLRYE